MPNSPSHIQDLTTALFRQEAEDLLTELDSALLQLEATPTDPQPIHRAFRSIHTLKGSGATAGFKDVSALLHEVEDIFADARDGRIQIDPTMIDLVLQIADLVRQMTFGSEQASAPILRRGKEIVATLKAQVRPRKVAVGSVTVAHAEGDDAADDDEQTNSVWSIRFVPASELFQTCNDPLLLFREVLLLGPGVSRVDAERLFGAPNFNPELCYLSWEIQVATAASRDKLQQIFAFAEDHADVRITAVRPEEAWVLPAAAYFDESVVQDFREEAQERVTEIETHVLTLEDRPDDRACPDALRRSLHNLKGLCGLLLSDARRPPPKHYPIRAMGELCHAAETFLEPLVDPSVLYHRERKPEILLELADWLRVLLRSFDDAKELWPTKLLEKLKRSEAHPLSAAGAAARTTPAGTDESAVGHRPGLAFNAVGAGFIPGKWISPKLSEAPVPAPAAPEAPQASGPKAVGTVAPLPSQRSRARTVSLRAGKPQAEPPPPPPETPGGPTPPRGIRVDHAKLDRLMRAVDELLVAKNSLPVLTHRVATADRATLGRDVKELAERIAHIADELQDTTRQIRMMPIRTIFQRFPRMIRDLARNQQKQVQLIISGEETELDKTVLEQVSNPLVHLIRNAVDHGIESPAERLACGKPEMGSVGLEVVKEGSHVVLHVSDDGRGMAPERLRKKAVEKGLLSDKDAANLSDESALDLVFLPGFSTAETITDISGRGVGMDAVRSNIRQLHGTIALSSNPGKGSMISIRLPSSVMVSKGVVVECAGQPYVLPVERVHQMEKVRAGSIRRFQEVSIASIRGEIYPIFWLAELLHLGKRQELSGRAEDGDEANTAIVSTRNGDVAIVVDRFVTQIDVVVKPLTEGLDKLLMFQGATILGDGQVALVLDTGHLEGLTAAALQTASTLPSHAALRDDRATSA